MLRLVLDTNILISALLFHPRRNLNHLCVTSLPIVSYSPDPDDNIILATAIAGKADYLVSGDKSDLLKLGIIEDILIITPRQALDILQQLIPT